MKNIFNCKSLFATITLCCFHSLVFYGQGNGPTQPEVSTFTPAGVTDMVNPSTGDFSYNLPLFDIGGYPVTMSYNAGRSMDEQASTVGLGWSLNTGVVSRSLRGIPDDFNGDVVQKNYNIKRNSTTGLIYGVKGELAGFPLPVSIGLTLGAYYNSYNGIGASFELGPTAAISGTLKDGNTIGLKLKADSEDGVSLSPTLSLSGKTTKQLSLTINSRRGLSDISLGLKKGTDKTVNIQRGKETMSASVGKSSTASFNFAGSGYSPSLDFPMINTAINAVFEAGGDVFPFALEGKIGGYRSDQLLMYRQSNTRSFGTMYLQNSSIEDLLDVNREKDGFVETDRTNIALPVMTNDVFSVSGHGFAGSFQLKRGDVGLLHDKYVLNPSVSSSAQVEAAVGNLLNIGANVSLSVAVSESGKWEADNDIKSRMTFINDNNNFTSEPAYFKYAGEMAVDEDDFFARTGGLDPVKAKLNVLQQSTLYFEKNDGTSLGLAANLQRNKREKRNSLIYHLTAAEAAQAGVEKDIKNYPLNDFTTAPTTISRNTGVRKADHISEITALKEDGMRYIFGLPAYNNIQKEKTFAVNGTQNCTTGLVPYTNNEDGINNASGKDNYFNETVTPAFAHSFFLTSVISPDFQDLTGNGPSSDDYGQYAKFNYSRVHENYKWRTPSAENMAQYTEGLKSDNLDQKASYIYGEKEYWYVHSIESKTDYAQFEYEDRQDLRGVKGEDGGFGTQSQVLKRLKSIKIFSLPDFKTNGANAIPLKVINFEHDYSLYTGTPDNTAGNGKLTLKKVYTTYQKSEKGAYSAYKFAYNTTPAYNALANNNWGTYKAPPTSLCNNTGPNPDEFPYIEQTNTNAALEDTYAGQGNISSITLPTGGIISVEYEADDYAFVQNKASMSLVKFEGIGTRSNSTLYSGLGNTATVNNKFYFKLKNNYTTLSLADAKKRMGGEYIKDILSDNQYVYFKTLVDVSSTGDYEYISTYAQVTDYGVESSTSNGTYDYGWITLKTEKANKTTGPVVTPIIKSALQFTRMNMPKLAFGNTNSNISDNLTTQFLSSLWSIVNNIAGFITGPNVAMMSRGMSRNVNLNKSFLRLYTPDGFKTGGGHRVKKIIISDNFNNMNSAYPAATYGMEYEYTTTPELGVPYNGAASSSIISSGVAEYEPLVGGEENPLRKPDFYGDTKFYAINNSQYLEFPYGETFYPSANVVYSKVKIKNLQFADVTQNDAGYTVQEFYTAKDFPTVSKKTSLTHKKFNPSPLLGLFNLGSINNAAYSQGFAVILNDMHGKQKATTMYSNNGTPTSYTKNIYKVNSKGELDNQVDVIKKDGTFVSASMGIDCQMFADARQSSNSVITPSAQLNLNNFVVPFLIPIYIAIPFGYATVSFDQTRFRSFATTKVIHQNGILQKTEVFKLGSTLYSENLAYDIETGVPLLTKTINEFEDPIYNFTMPAHWVYDGMEGAYQNIKGKLNGTHTITTGGKVSTTAFNQYLALGDELWNPNTPTQRYWVKEISPTVGFYVVDAAGATPASGTLENSIIIRSGHRNMQNNPVMNITSMVLPRSNNALSFSASTKILDAQISEYTDSWQYACSNCGSAASATTNMYRLNKFGNWRPAVGWKYGAKRVQFNGDIAANDPKLQTEGYYSTFTPFWTLTNNVWTRVVTGNVIPSGQSSDWVRLDQTTRFHPNGSALESRDALDIYHSQLLGFSNTQVVATADNARYSHTGFDGFEDYIFENISASPCQGGSTSCTYDWSGCYHFPLVGFPTTAYVPYTTTAGAGKIYTQDSHTGKYSVAVLSTDAVYYQAQTECTTNNYIVGSEDYKNTGSCSCMSGFVAAAVGGEFVVSGWVRALSAASTDVTYDGKAEISISGSTASTFKPTGPIIDGWQRVYGVFTVPAKTPTTSNNYQINLRNTTTTSGQVVLFDDVRVHPFNASFKTFVYDDLNLRFTYELDEDNYYKKYEYDQQGTLERVKKETEKGVMMVQESRFGGQKIN